MLILVSISFVNGNSSIDCELSIPLEFNAPVSGIVYSSTSAFSANVVYRSFLASSVNVVLKFFPENLLLTIVFVK